MKYQCDICGGNVKVVRKRVRDEGNGLPNVHLDNLDVRICIKCQTEHSRSYPRAKTLSSIIGRALALQNGRLSGASAQFLRKHAGVKSTAWADIMSVDPATVSRWESSSQVISPQSDKLIRVLYFHLLSEKDGAPIPHELGKVLRNRQAMDEAPIIVIDAQRMTYKYESRRDKAA